MVMEPDAIMAVASEIAGQLGETEPEPRAQIARVVEHCGVEFARKILRKTLDAEAKGGILVKSGERRRTPGGVFFFLAKGRMSPRQFEQVFPDLEYPHQRKQPDTDSPPSSKQDEPQAASSPARMPAQEPLPTLPANAPPEVIDRLHQLHRAAATFRKKIATLEASDQPTGIEMTRRLLENTEKQIADLEAQYAD